MSAVEQQLPAPQHRDAVGVHHLAKLDRMVGQSFVERSFTRQQRYDLILKAAQANAFAKGLSLLLCLDLTR
jgi:hypothetical protein